VVNDLVAARYVARRRVGHRLMYTVNQHRPLRLPAVEHVEVKVLLDLNIQLARWDALQPGSSALSAGTGRDSAGQHVTGERTGRGSKRTRRVGAKRNPSSRNTDKRQ